MRNWNWKNEKLKRYKIKQLEKSKYRNIENLKQLKIWKIEIFKYWTNWKIDILNHQGIENFCNWIEYSRKVLKIQWLIETFNYWKT